MANFAGYTRRRISPLPTPTSWLQRVLLTFYAAGRPLRAMLSPYYRSWQSALEILDSGICDLGLTEVQRSEL